MVAVPNSILGRRKIGTIHWYLTRFPPEGGVNSQGCTCMPHAPKGFKCQPMHLVHLGHTRIIFKTEINCTIHMHAWLTPLFVSLCANVVAWPVAGA